MTTTHLFGEHLETYQEAALAWAGDKAGFILAGEPGTGKTRMSLAHCLRQTEQARSAPLLILAPVGTFEHWQAEIALLIGGQADVLVYHGTGRQARFASWWTSPGSGSGNSFRIVLTSPQTYRYDAGAAKELRLAGGTCEVTVPLPSLMSCAYSFAILDEAHFYRNPKSKAFEAVAENLRCEVRCLLTGTPYYNDTKDMVSLALLAGMAPYNVPGWWRLADDEQREAWRATYCYQILKDDVLTLPTLMVHTHLVELTKAQRDYYRTVSSGCYPCGLTKILRQRQATCLSPPGRRGLSNNSRAQKIIEIVQSVRKGAPEERVVIFSCFRDMLDELAQYLRDEKGREPACYHGGLNKNERAAVLEEFQNTEGAVLLVSLMAGGAGLNLQSANHAILSEPYWNYATSAQAMDRIYRLGQQRVCQVHCLVTNTPTDHHILRKQEVKINGFRDFTPEHKQVVRVDLHKTGQEVANAVDMAYLFGVGQKGAMGPRTTRLAVIDMLLSKTKLGCSASARQEILRQYCHPHPLPLDMAFLFGVYAQQSRIAQEAKQAAVLAPLELPVVAVPKVRIIRHTPIAVPISV